MSEMLANGCPRVRYDAESGLAAVQFYPDEEVVFLEREEAVKLVKGLALAFQLEPLETAP